jgi:hypothetical protein
VAAGRQAYVVYPLVEESDKVDLKAATEMADHLAQEVFPEFRVGLLHGRMKPDGKDRVMRAFAAGELDILVSTTVIEVGVDVPNASVMIVEHAERFGLSQLHQLRGRVGRDRCQSHCCQAYQTPPDEPASACGRSPRPPMASRSPSAIALRGPGDSSHPPGRHPDVPVDRPAARSRPLDLAPRGGRVARLLAPDAVGDHGNASGVGDKVQAHRYGIG